MILVLFNSALYYILEQNTKLSIQNNLYHKAVSINNKILLNNNEKNFFKNDEVESFDMAIVKEGKIIHKKGKTQFRSLVRFIDDKKSFFIFSKNKNLDGLYILRITKPFKGAILFYEKDLNSKIAIKLKEIKDILFILEPILFLLLMFMVSKVTDKILQSINKITTTANQIYVTDFSTEIPPPKYDDEIKDLVDSFNLMIKRLKNGVQLLEQFNSDVSHELKTPLTVIKGEIELALNKKRDVAYYEKTLKVVSSESDQIQSIVDNLLLLTKYNQDNIKNTFREVNIDSLLLTVVEKFNSQLKARCITLNIKEFESISMSANTILITSVFSNLIDNAIKYSLNNTNINIYLCKKEKIHFIIEDEGIGIAKEDLKKVQDRFYRVDESRNKKIKGFGLGLSIVKNSISLHQGSMEITSKENVGTRIEVML
ncbi:HAMP domain-containing sensor histidine kinase [Arcobacteraceae bacterium]|nr:HAMP domain-containing sensor histidine kinase [Arcobacteraceae bacterium]